MDQVTLTSKQTELPSLRMLAMESHLSRQGGTIEKVQLTIQKAVNALGMERPPNVLEALEKMDEMSSNAEYLRFTNEGYDHAKESISELQSYGLTIKSISELMQQIELFQLKKDNPFNRSMYGRAVSQISAQALLDVIKLQGGISVNYNAGNQTVGTQWVPIKSG